jgi:hypothetical protein
MKEGAISWGTKVRVKKVRFKLPQQWNHSVGALACEICWRNPILVVSGGRVPHHSWFSSSYECQKGALAESAFQADISSSGV